MTYITGQCVFIDYCVTGLYNVIFYLPTFSVFVTLGYLNHSQGLPKILSTSKVESLKGIRGKNNNKKKIIGNSAKEA